MAAHTIALITLLALARFTAWAAFRVPPDKREGAALLCLTGAPPVLYSLVGRVQQDLMISSVSKVLLSGPVFYSSIIGAMALFVFNCVFTFASISWPAGSRITFVLNGKSIVEDSTLRADDGRATFLLRTFNWVELQVSRQTFRFYNLPFHPRDLKIPKELVETELDKIDRVEELLFLIFLQHSPGHFLDKAMQELKTLSTAQAELFGNIAAVLSACFIGRRDPEEARQALRRVDSKLCGENWMSLLRASTYHCESEYLVATAAIAVESTKFTASATQHCVISYFRAVCLLRVYILAVRDGGRNTREVLNSIISALNDSERQLSTISDNFIFGYYRPHIKTIRAITFYYSGQFDLSEREFIEAGKEGRPLLRARAVNGSGFLALLMNKNADANLAFTSALQMDPDSAIVRNNLGYCRLNQGNAVAALTIFDDIVSDARLKEESPRDHFLARVNCLYVKSITTTTCIKDLIGLYEQLLRDYNAPSFAHIEPPHLRLAFIHSNVARMIYEDGRYYALEVFAALNMALAYAESVEARLEAADTTLCSHVEFIVERAMSDFSRIPLSSLLDRTIGAILLEPIRGYYQQTR